MSATVHSAYEKPPSYRAYSRRCTSQNSRHLTRCFKYRAGFCVLNQTMTSRCSLINHHRRLQTSKLILSRWIQVQ